MNIKMLMKKNGIFFFIICLFFSFASFENISAMYKKSVSSKSTDFITFINTLKKFFTGNPETLKLKDLDLNFKSCDINTFLNMVGQNVNYFSEFKINIAKLCDFLITLYDDNSGIEKNEDFQAARNFLSDLYDATLKLKAQSPVRTGLINIFDNTTSSFDDFLKNTEVKVKKISEKEKQKVKSKKEESKSGEEEEQPKKKIEKKSEKKIIEKEKQSKKEKKKEQKEENKKKLKKLKKEEELESSEEEQPKKKIAKKSEKKIIEEEKPSKKEKKEEKPKTEKKIELKKKKIEEQAPKEKKEEKKEEIEKEEKKKIVYIPTEQKISTKKIITEQPQQPLEQFQQGSFFFPTEIKQIKKSQIPQSQIQQSLIQQQPIQQQQPLSESTLQKMENVKQRVQQQQLIQQQIPVQQSQIQQQLQQSQLQSQQSIIQQKVQNLLTSGYPLYKDVIKYIFSIEEEETINKNMNDYLNDYRTEYSKEFKNLGSLLSKSPLNVEIKELDALNININNLNSENPFDGSSKFNGQNINYDFTYFCNVIRSFGGIYIKMIDGIQKGYFDKVENAEDYNTYLWLDVNMVMYPFFDEIGVKIFEKLVNYYIDNISAYVSTVNNNEEKIAFIKSMLYGIVLKDIEDAKTTLSNKTSNIQNFDSSKFVLTFGDLRASFDSLIEGLLEVLKQKVKELKGGEEDDQTEFYTSMIMQKRPSAKKSVMSMSGLGVSLMAPTGTYNKTKKMLESKTLINIKNNNKAFVGQIESFQQMLGVANYINEKLSKLEMYMALFKMKDNNDNKLSIGWDDAARMLNDAWEEVYNVYVKFAAQIAPMYAGKICPDILSSPNLSIINSVSGIFGDFASLLIDIVASANNDKDSVYLLTIMTLIRETIGSVANNNNLIFNDAKIRKDFNFNNWNQDVKSALDSWIKQLAAVTKGIAEQIDKYFNYDFVKKQEKNVKVMLQQNANQMEQKLQQSMINLSKSQQISNIQQQPIQQPVKQSQQFQVNQPQQQFQQQNIQQPQQFQPPQFQMQQPSQILQQPRFQQQIQQQQPIQQPQQQPLSQQQIINALNGYETAIKNGMDSNTAINWVAQVYGKPAADAIIIILQQFQQQIQQQQPQPQQPQQYQQSVYQFLPQQ